MAEVDEIIEDMSEMQKYIVLLLSSNNKESIKRSDFLSEKKFIKRLKEVIEG